MLITRNRYFKSCNPKNYESGIYVFPEAVKPGTDALEALYLNDQVMEFDLTPNRADALSMVGTAYEVAALYQTKMNKTSVNKQ